MPSQVNLLMHKVKQPCNGIKPGIQSPLHHISTPSCQTKSASWGLPMLSGVTSKAAGGLQGMNVHIGG